MVRVNSLREFASHARCGGWSASLREPKTPGKGSLNQLKTGLIERPRPRKPRIRSQAESGTSGLHLSERKIRAKLAKLSAAETERKLQDSCARKRILPQAVLSAILEKFKNERCESGFGALFENLLMASRVGFRRFQTACSALKSCPDSHLQSVVGKLKMIEAKNKVFFSKLSWIVYCRLADCNNIVQCFHQLRAGGQKVSPREARLYMIAVYNVHGLKAYKESYEATSDVYNAPSVGMLHDRIYLLSKHGLEREAKDALLELKSCQRAGPEIFCANSIVSLSMLGRIRELDSFVDGILRDEQPLAIPVQNAIRESYTIHRMPKKLAEIERKVSEWKHPSEHLAPRRELTQFGRIKACGRIVVSENLKALVADRKFDDLKRSETEDLLLQYWRNESQPVSARRAAFVALLRLKALNSSQLFEVLHREDLPLNIACYQAMIMAFDEPKDGSRFVDEGVRNRIFGFSVPVRHSLMNLYSMSGYHEESRHQFLDCRSQGFTPSWAMYRSLLLDLYRTGDHDNAQEELQRMHADGILLSENEYLEMLRILSQSRAAETATNFVEDLHAAGVRLTCRTYNGLMQILAKEAMAQQAVAVFQKMEDRGVAKDVVSGYLKATAIGAV